MSNIVPPAWESNQSPTFSNNIFSISDLEVIGSKVLLKAHREYYNLGAMDLVTLKDNADAYRRYKIIPRVLRNVSHVDTSSPFLGQKTSFPLGISPTAVQRLAHSDGELATSRAAANIGVSMCLSSYSNTSLENVKLQERGNPYMMQMAAVRDRAITRRLIVRAEAVGYKAIFWSVDTPVSGRRWNESRNKLIDFGKFGLPNHLGPVEGEAEVEGAMQYDDTLEWKEIIPWLRLNTKMQIWLKGVLSPDDVELAIAHGVDGVVISNHGGRQLDHAPATLDALRLCAPIAKGRIQIAIDGGIRRGSDIFKAIATGAQYCFIGRPILWGLAYNGQQGVELALKILREEFRVTMALAGCRTVADIRIEHLAYLDHTGCLAKL